MVHLKNQLFLIKNYLITHIDLFQLQLKIMACQLDLLSAFYSCLIDFREKGPILYGSQPCPSLTARIALCLVTHLVYYRGSKNYTQVKLSFLVFSFSVFTGDERSNLVPHRYTCTMIMVFYSPGWEDWTAGLLKKIPLQRALQGLQLLILHKGCSYEFPYNSPNWETV